MPDFISTQQPEIVLASVCGPAASLRKEGLPLFLYAVYSFPAYMYTGFPDCSPKADPKKISELIKDGATPKAFNNRLTSYFVMRDDEYLRALWRGSLWPVVSLFSPVCEVFSEAGGYLVQNREKFLCRETAKRWIGSQISDKDLSPSLAWSLAEKLCVDPGFDPFISHSRKILDRIEDPEIRTADRKRIVSLINNRKENLPQRLNKADLNRILITMRGLS